MKYVLLKNNADGGGGEVVATRLADNLAPDPIWHRTQFGTGPNLAPRVLWGQFGTKSVKESIWHRTQFGTKSVKGVNLAPESIWHRTNLAPRVQKSQFGTGPNLAPESIWHHAKGIHFITLYSRNMKVICNKYNFAILRNLFESFFKSSLQVKPQDMYPPQILAIKVQY